VMYQSPDLSIHVQVERLTKISIGGHSSLGNSAFSMDRLLVSKLCRK